MTRGRNHPGPSAARKAVLAGLIGSTLLLGGCSAVEGALWGAYLGAIIGAPSGAADVGAAIGAGIGAVIGAESERCGCHACTAHYYRY